MNLAEISRVAEIIHRRWRRSGRFYESFIEGEKEGFEKTSFTGNDELFMYYHPRAAVREIFDRHALSVIREFEIDYPETDGCITQEIAYIGTKGRRRK